LNRRDTQNARGQLDMSIDPNAPRASTFGRAIAVLFIERSRAYSEHEVRSSRRVNANRSEAKHLNRTLLRCVECSIIDVQGVLVEPVNLRWMFCRQPVFAAAPVPPVEVQFASRPAFVNPSSENCRFACRGLPRRFSHRKHHPNV